MILQMIGLGVLLIVTLGVLGALVSGNQKPQPTRAATVATLATPVPTATPKLVAEGAEPGSDYYDIQPMPVPTSTPGGEGRFEQYFRRGFEIGRSRKSPAEQMKALGHLMDEAIEEMQDDEEQ